MEKQKELLWVQMVPSTLGIPRKSIKRDLCLDTPTSKEVSHTISAVLGAQ